MADDDKFSSKEMVVRMAQHLETILILTKHLGSEHPCVDEALADVAKVKQYHGNRCFLTGVMMNELYSRDHLNESDMSEEEVKSSLGEEYDEGED